MGTLIVNACVITGNDAGDVHPGGFVHLDGARIAAVGPMTQAPPADGLQIVDAAGGFVTPGLINMHQHLHMNLMKGLADELWEIGMFYAEGGRIFGPLGWTPCNIFGRMVEGLDGFAAQCQRIRLDGVKLVEIGRM